MWGSDFLQKKEYIKVDGIKIVWSSKGEFP